MDKQRKLGLVTKVLERNVRNGWTSQLAGEYHGDMLDFIEHHADLADDPEFKAFVATCVLLGMELRRAENWDRIRLGVKEDLRKLNSKLNPRKPKPLTEEQRLIVQRYDRVLESEGYRTALRKVRKEFNRSNLSIKTISDWRKKL